MGWHIVREKIGKELAGKSREINMIGIHCAKFS